MIPALAHAEYARYGVMHRNTFLNSPMLLDDHFRFREGLYFAGQVTGVEGYTELRGLGPWLPGLSCSRTWSGRIRTDWTDETVLGAMGRYVASANRNFQPMNATFGLLAPLAGKKIRVKKERYAGHRRALPAKDRRNRERTVKVGRAAPACATFLFFRR